MDPLFALGISTAVICGIWSVVAGMAGLISWGGFAGCTTYFACGEHGMKGVKKAIATNVFGVICGVLTIMLNDLIPMFGELGIWCACLTFVMCMVSKYEWFSYCPGIFVGCFSTFAAMGNYGLLIPSLILGACLGASCEFGGKLLEKASNKNNNKKESNLA